MRLRALAATLIICFSQGAWAQVDYEWNQGAVPGAFEDLSNWTGAGATFENDRIYGFVVTGNNATLGTGQDITIGGFNITAGAELTIESGARLQNDVSGTGGAKLGRGTLNVNGTLDFGMARWELRSGNLEAVLNINSGATLISTGEFSRGLANRNAINATLNFNSANITMKVASFGVNGFDQVINVNPGAVWNVSHSITLGAGTTGRTAIHLNGGTLDFRGPDT